MTVSKGRHITKIQQTIFGAMVLITVLMTVVIIFVSIWVNLDDEKQSLDGNLINMASAISNSEVIREELSSGSLTKQGSYMYLDDLKASVSNVDVISIISSDGVRLYHTNNELINTVYDGTVPDFNSNGNIYVSSDVGPSGSQRRVYGAIFDEEGNYEGFVIVVLLNQHISEIINRTVLIYLLIAFLIIVASVVVSNSISRRIKKSLLGYEPDAFSAMYSVRDNILESFEEGVIAIDYTEKILFMNKAAQKICNVGSNYSLNIKDYPILSRRDINRVIKTGEKIVGITARTESNIDALINYYPVIEDSRIIGAICVLLDRTEYTTMMDDLTGVKFLVDSMRANNHDFTNKLHVILGLVQMGANKDAAEYITHITTIQQDIISGIMRNIENPSIAALLIGKYSKASELNVSFTLESGSQYRNSDVSFNSSDLVTIIGNLIENAFESMNMPDLKIKELTIGIFTKPGAMIIRVDDTGLGIPYEMRANLFDKGITSKGENHGTGLFLVKHLVEKYRGTITFESEIGEGTSFEVSLIDDSSEVNNNV